MNNAKQERKAVRVWIWGMPVLAALAAALFTLLLPVKPRLEQRIGASRQDGWAIELPDYSFYSYPVGQALKGGDIDVDAQGRIWVAGDGLHMFDGSHWQSRSGSHIDLGPGPNGELWAVTYDRWPNGLVRYDGKVWQSYPSHELGTDEQMIRQIEVDGRGRIWLATEQFGTDYLIEMVAAGRGGYAVVTEPELTIDFGDITAMDVDQAGKLWVAIAQYADHPTERPSGLYRLDGDSWERIPDEGVDLQRILQTRCDDQGRTWVLTRHSDVLRYDQQGWTTIVDGDSAPAGDGYNKTSGFYADEQDRLWLWQTSENVSVLSDQQWTTYTGENSGIAAGARRLYRDGFSYPLQILGVMVDESDQLHVFTSEGASTIAVETARPLSEESVAHNRLLLALADRIEGLNWYVPVLLLGLWLALFLDALPGVLTAVVLCGIAVLLYRGPGTSDLNPLVVGPLAGIAGGLLGGLIDRRRKQSGASRSYWNVILAIGGTLAGTLAVVYYVLLTTD